MKEGVGIRDGFNGLWLNVNKKEKTTTKKRKEDKVRSSKPHAVHLKLLLPIDILHIALDGCFLYFFGRQCLEENRTALNV